MSISLILLLSAGLIILLLLVVAPLLTRDARIIRQRISEQYIVKPSTTRKHKKSKGGSRVDLFPTITDFLCGKAFAEKMQLELLRANLFLRPAEFVAIILISATGLLLLGCLFTTNIFILLALGAMGYFVPRLYVKHLQQKRVAAFEKQIADALMLISSSLRTGYSFLRAIQTVAEQMPPPISEEFERVVYETSLGAPMADALSHLVIRVPSYDLDLVVTAVLIQLETGGNLSQILENISETIRERCRIAGEIKILVSEGKLSGVIVGLLPIFMGILLTIINPNYTKPLFTTSIGQTMLGVGFFLQILGARLIKKMIAIDV